MKFGLFALNYGTCADPSVAVQVARYAEDAGLESLWTGEHLVLPDPQPVGVHMAPTLPFLDSVVALTLLAAETTRIHLGSGIIELPLHHPIMLAKQCASIDQISNGRLILGIGAGHLVPEFDAMGVPMSERGRRMDEYLDAMRALWTMPQPEYHGELVSFSEINAFPRPVAPEGIPIVTGGVSEGARRRTIRKANGWYLFNADLAIVEEAMAIITNEQQEIERPEHLGRLEISVTPNAPIDAAAVERYAALGVDRLILLPDPTAASEDRHRPIAVDDILRTIDLIAELSDAPRG
ncbi:MAG: TIGR03619 family F420-dependent LLM class oxidoreductase [Acidimicrobiales bacterium]